MTDSQNKKSLKSRVDSLSAKESSGKRPQVNKEKLRKLLHEIKQGKLSKDPNAYNHKPEKFKEGEKLSSILKKIFKAQGKKVPAGSILRIEMSMKSNKLNIHELATKYGANFWKVENGKLIFFSNNKSQPYIFRIDLLPWTALKQGVETLEQHRHEYELGKYKSVQEYKNIDNIEGSVDATPYSAKLQTESWYREKAKAAKLLLELDKKRFDEPTKKLIKKHKNILEQLAAEEEKTFTPQKFCESFEKGKSNAELIGANGIYNFVLAFQRVMKAFGSGEASIKSSAAIITLSIGKSVRTKSQRFIKLETGVQPLDSHGQFKQPKKAEVAYQVTAGREKREEREKKYRTGRGTKRGGLAPGAEQFNEQMSPEIASKILIESYRANGIQSFVEGLNTLKAMDPEKAEEAYMKVFETLGAENRQEAAKLLSEILEGSNENLKERFDVAIKKAIEAEPNEENKKVMKLMKLTNDIKYAAENEGAQNNTMREIMKKIKDINENQITGEYKEFFVNFKNTLESRMRGSMALDILQSTQNGIQASLLDHTKKDVYFVNSLEELKGMSNSELAKALRNEGMGNWLDSDAEVYIAVSHITEAMRLYLTYLYPQAAVEALEKGDIIQNPIKWAYEHIKKGTKITMPEGWEKNEADVINDVYKGEKTIGKTIDVESLFVAKDVEIRLFEEYQKGEERVGETSIWNLAPTDTVDGAATGAAMGG